MDAHVHSSAEWIAGNAADVEVDASGVRTAAGNLVSAIEAGGFSLSNWKEHPLNPSECNEDSISWIFLVDTLNFSFWHDDDAVPFTVSYHGTSFTGYWALCAAVNRALEEGIPLLSPSYQASVSREDLLQIFRSETPTLIPLLDERLSVLHEAGRVILEKFAGSAVTLVSQANKSVKALLKLLASHFTSYNDGGVFKGRDVQFLKRAQIFVADVWACFEGASFGEFVDIDTLTMFADYRVPQALVYMGVLKYSDELLRTLEARSELESGSRLEMEIRGCSIWGVELVIEELRRREEVSSLDYDGPINAVTVDFYLWDYAKSHRKDMAHIPIHRTRSVFY